uniref:Uncharacterized protein n=1 Tax=viral metagenome TaxID=1070528 RepID=A0A6C0K4B2_9ZZZZ
MSEHLPVRSIVFIEGNECSDEIVIPQRLFTEWLDFFPHGSSMLATLTYEGLKRVVCIGSGHASEYLYCPQWILNHLGSLDDESLVTVEPYLETLPIATRIVLKVLYREDESMDLRSAVETHLDRFHVLEPETTLDIHAESPLCVWVEAVEPFGCVALGGEVILEFLEEEPEPEPEPEPEQPEQPEQQEQQPAIATSMTADQKEVMRLARIKRFTLQSS